MKNKNNEIRYEYSLVRESPAAEIREIVFAEDLQKAYDAINITIDGLNNGCDSKKSKWSLNALTNTLLTIG